MSHDDNPSEVNQSQVAAKNLTAERDIRIGSIIQKIIYLGLPLNGQHLRFVQFLANSACLTCLICVFIRLWQNGADFTTLLLLITSSGLLSLTCLYYAWFWKPGVQDKSAPITELSDSDESVKAQPDKKQLRQQARRLAIIGTFAIPLLSGAGFWVWQSLPPTNTLLLVANFNGPNQQNYQVTETILRNLRNASEAYTNVKVRALNQPITEQQGSEFARAEGAQKKATIVIWGDYGVTQTDAQIGVHFEVLKPLTYFPALGRTARGEIQTSAIAELNSFKLQTRLSKGMAYLTLFTLGMVQFAKEDWDGAISRFSASLEQVEEPITTLGQEAVYFYRGICFLFKNDYKRALTDYTKALKLMPDFAEAYNNRGNVYAGQGNYTLAITDYTKALKLMPDFAEAYNNRGLAYTIQGNYTLAITDYTKALKLMPDFAEAYNNRGLAYANQGNYTLAITDFTQALKLMPDFAEAYSNRGGAYTRQGNYTQAITDYTQALKLKTDAANVYSNQGNVFALIYSNRGNAYTKQGNYAQAITDFTQSLKLEPDAANTYYKKARVYSLKGEVKTAIENLQQAIDLDATLRKYAKTDSTFGNILKDKQFQALVSQ